MPDEDDEENLKVFLEDHRVVAPTFVKPGGRKAKKSLVGSSVEGSAIQPNPGGLEKVRLMKVVSIERTDDTKVAHIDLRVKDGTLVRLEIDEATAQSIAGVFLV